jgi:ubiquinone/menaquinone biosynthesis C-methylase UbiE
MDLGFHGEVVDFYHKYRHGYPPATIDAIAEVFQLTGDDIAVDLGCGTGQLTVPLAGRVRAAVGVDPEPDMLRRAREAARDVPNVSWLLGGDTDIATLIALLGENSVAAVTIGQALHWMNHEQLFLAARRLVRSGGGIAVITNGTPLWLQDTAWSRALHAFMEDWLQTTISYACGTDEQSQRTYAAALTEAGYGVTSAAVDYDVRLSIEEIVGGVFSATSPGRLPPPGDREAFTERVRDALAQYRPYIEHVHVAVLAGRRTDRRTNRLTGR